MSLESAARAWIAADPDPQTRAELQGFLDARNLAELSERMAGNLEFGTAGLRGVVGAGPNRMNRAVVIRTTRALAEYLRDREPDARTLPVVLGFDARLSSRAFAEDAAAVLVAAGIPVRFFPEPVPTPLVAFAVRAFAASAGIVITASHNPPEYNGYKVYGSNGIQINTPVDREVRERAAPIQAVSVPRAEGVFEGKQEKAQPISDAIFERYLAELGGVIPRGSGPRDLRIVYTPLHGVGARFAERALAAFGFTHLECVSEQAVPDGRFPTVRFPNPEEPGALDLGLALAQRTHAELLIANDPDADRLAACVPTPSGLWQPLTGNQVGLLLADFVLGSAARTPQPLVVSSIVSSPMLASIAARHGAAFEQTLTGFKWIWLAALELQQTCPVRFVFGYEEALGYSVGQLVRDKDGLSAAVLLCELASACKARGKTVLEHLAELYREHGLWVSVQKSVVCPGSEGVQQIRRAIEELAAQPPEALGGRRVRSFTDFTRGAEARPRWLGKAALCALELENGARVLARPSGTEPKLKIYVDLSVPVSADQTISVRQTEALAQANAVAESLSSLLRLDGS